jgi:predicted nucleic acid-binding protein
MVKRIVCDSSSIISMAVNCMCSFLGEMKAELVVNKEVYDEIVSRPSGSKRYALESIRIKKLFNEGTIKVAEANPRLTDEIIEISNSIYSVKKQYIKLIHRGEAGALALVRDIDADGFLIDERTMRMILEDPEMLSSVLRSQTNQRVEINYRNLEVFRELVPQVKIIRSSEVAAVAYEKGVLGENLGDNRKEAFLAVLYALKFSGCAISWDEIDEYTSILK